MVKSISVGIVHRDIFFMQIDLTNGQQLTLNVTKGMWTELHAGIGKTIELSAAAPPPPPAN